MPVMRVNVVFTSLKWKAASVGAKISKGCSKPVVDGSGDDRCTEGRGVASQTNQYF